MRFARSGGGRSWQLRPSIGECEWDANKRKKTWELFLTERSRHSWAGDRVRRAPDRWVARRPPCWPIRWSRRRRRTWSARRRWPRSAAAATVVRPVVVAAAVVAAAAAVLFEEAEERETEEEDGESHPCLDAGDSGLEIGRRRVDWHVDDASVIDVGAGLGCHLAAGCDPQVPRLNPTLPSVKLLLLFLLLLLLLTWSSNWA